MENRMLKEFPTFADHPELDAGEKLINYAWDFEAYVKDRVAFRAQFVGIGKQIRDFVKPVVYREGQLVYLNGRENHKYYAGMNGWLIEKFQGKPLLTAEQLQKLSAGLNNIADYLGERNIPLIIIICPDKDSVYPEYYPEIFKQAVAPIPLDIVTDYLNSNVNASVYSSKDELIANKEQFRTYNKSEGDLSHYNSVGGFIEYQELIRHLKEYFLEMEVLSFDDVDISYNENGDQIAEIKDTSRIRQLEATFFENIPAEIRPVFRTGIEINGFENDDSSLPTALFMADSYYLTYGIFVAANFHLSVGIHYDYIEHFTEYLDLFQPDVVIIQVAERAIPDFADIIAPPIKY
jgi:hypothetical protein